MKIGNGTVRFVMAGLLLSCMITISGVAAEKPRSRMTVSADGKLAVLALDCQNTQTVEWCVNFAVVDPIESAYEKKQCDE